MRGSWWLPVWLLAGALAVAAPPDPTGPAWPGTADGRPLGRIRADLPAGVPAAESTPVRPPPAAMPRRPPRWFPLLRRHLRAVDVCVAATTRRPAAVLEVSELPFEMVSVVVRDASGRLWDCVVERTGGAPLRFDPLPPAEVLFGRVPDPVFYRGDSPAGEACAVAETARDPVDGRVLGTLVYRQGCQ